jgi:hypothetical protein
MRAQRPGESALLLLDAIDVLTGAGIPYAVIGAMAASVHGVVRASIDSYDNRVDFLVGLRGLDPEAFARAIKVNFQDQALHVAALEDFVAMKLFAHGPQDIADARHALELAEGSVDVALLRMLAERFGRETLATLDALLRERDGD